MNNSWIASNRKPFQHCVRRLNAFLRGNLDENALVRVLGACADSKWLDGVQATHRALLAPQHSRNKLNQNSDLPSRRLRNKVAWAYRRCGQLDVAWRLCYAQLEAGDRDEHALRRALELCGDAGDLARVRSVCADMARHSDAVSLWAQRGGAGRLAERLWQMRRRGERRARLAQTRRARDAQARQWPAVRRTYVASAANIEALRLYDEMAHIAGHRHGPRGQGDIPRVWRDICERGDVTAAFDSRALLWLLRCAAASQSERVGQRLAADMWRRLVLGARVSPCAGSATIALQLLGDGDLAQRIASSLLLLDCAMLSPMDAQRCVCALAKMRRLRTRALSTRATAESTTRTRSS